jgi:5,10-methylenetetrahydromethanopterin reductase
MRIGALMDVERPLGQVIDQVQRYAEGGFDTAWATQIFGFDALTLLGVVATKVSGIKFGTGVVPVYARHPQVMAQQALTVQAASGGRLTLGIGLSHKLVVENLWGLSYDRPARYMREYLDVLMPMLAREPVSVHGEVVSATTMGALNIADAEPPSVLVAALGSKMLELAGAKTSGTVTWMTGTRTIGEHIAPTITAAAAAAGRPAPRIAVALPITVTNDAEAARERIDNAYSFYPTLPSYKAMLDKEQAQRPSDIALVGTDDEVIAGLLKLEQAGATDFVAAVSGNPDEVKATFALLLSRVG